MKAHYYLNTPTRKAYHGHAGPDVPPRDPGGVQPKVFSRDISLRRGRHTGYPGTRDQKTSRKGPKEPSWRGGRPFL